MNQLVVLFNDSLEELEETDSTSLDKYIYLTVIIENIAEIIKDTNYSESKKDNLSIVFGKEYF